MKLLCDFYKSTLGKKIIMAITGAALVLFVIGHMAGNLKMFAGIDPETGRYKMDLYAEFLRSIGAAFMGHETFLWIARVGLLGCVFFHVLMAIQLSALKKKARPIGYIAQDYRSSTLASRYMGIGGTIILFFIVFHILHFTTGDLHTNGFVHGLVYSNVWLGFQIPWVTAFYVIAMAALCSHLFHGAWSMFQTLGIDSPRLNPILRNGAKAIAIIVFVGMTSIPLASSFGFLKPPVATGTLVADKD